MIRIQRFHLSDLAAILVIVVLLISLLLMQPKRDHNPDCVMSRCTANLKQLGNAAALYEEDNVGARPGPQPQGPATPWVSWDRPLAIQMGAGMGIEEPLANLTRNLTRNHPASRILENFACWVDRQRKGACANPPVPGSLMAGLASGSGLCRSYVLNLGSANLAGEDDGIAATASAIPAAKIESAAATVFLIESHGYATVFGQANIANDATMACTRAGRVLPADAFTSSQVLMHATRPQGNVLMYDGHVETFDQEIVVANGGQIMQYPKAGGPEVAR